MAAGNRRERRVGYRSSLVLKRCQRSHGGLYAPTDLGPCMDPPRGPKPEPPELARRHPRTKGLHARVHRSQHALAGPPDRQVGFVTHGHEGAPREVPRAQLGAREAAAGVRLLDTPLPLHSLAARLAGVGWTANVLSTPRVCDGRAGEWSEMATPFHSLPPPGIQS